MVTQNGFTMDGGAQVRAWVTNLSSPNSSFHFLPFHDFQALPKDLFF
jgi:hypothetical protein